jgi:hypothetical protein
MLFHKDKCCNPRSKPCWKDSIRKATAHAEERSKATGKNQSVVWDKSKNAWKITTS